MPEWCTEQSGDDDVLARAVGEFVERLRAGRARSGRRPRAPTPTPIGRGPARRGAAARGRRSSAPTAASATAELIAFRRSFGAIDPEIANGPLQRPAQERRRHARRQLHQARRRRCSSSCVAERPRGRHRERVGVLRGRARASATRCARSPTSRRATASPRSTRTGRCCSNTCADAIARPAPTPERRSRPIRPRSAACPANRRPQRRPSTRCSTSSTSSSASTDVKREVRLLVNLTRVEKLCAGSTTCRFPIAAATSCSSAIPGTGKTTVARLLSRIYGVLGVLEQGSPRRDRPQRHWSRATSARPRPRCRRS